MNTDDIIEAGAQIRGRCRSRAEECWVESVVIVSRGGYNHYQPLCPNCQQPLISEEVVRDDEVEPGVHGIEEGG